MKTRTKSWLVAVVGLLAVVGALVGIKAAQIGKMIQAGKSFVPPPESVSSAKAEQATWRGSQPAIGTVVAVRAAMLGAELAGLVREISFDSGQAVKQGAVLVKLDTSAEEAQLAAALAEESLAKIGLERARTLRKAGSNAPADLDAAEARAKGTAATVAALRATIAKKTIRAPFDGRLAIRQVELGQVIAAGAPIASLQSVTPVYVDFWLPQQALAQLRAGQKIQVRADIYPDASWSGAVTTVNPEVDVATRNVRVRASVPNGDGRLKPGMYVSVDVLANEERKVLVVPATAIIYAPYGDSVFVLEQKQDEPGKGSLVARQRFVRVGERRGDFVVVESGLQAGEGVVGSGGFKLRNGMAVVVNDALAPKPELAPKPADR